MTASLRSLAKPLAALAGVALHLALAAAPATAQCIGPDGLDGPCCAPVTPNLPPFPPIADSASGFCWTACTLSGQRQLRVLTSPPLPVSCTQYHADLSVIDGTTGATIAFGLLVLDYTRTWREIDPAGADHQVWRFAAKVDLTATAGVPIGCPVPSCLPSQGTAFFYGYADWAAQCGTVGFDNALVLFHNCDTFIHGPAHSSKPGTFHPGESFAIVSPDDPGSPFVPVSIPRPGGPLVGEGFRSNIPGAITCRAEEFVTGDLIPVIDACGCPLSLSSDQLTASVFKGASACGSSFTSLDTFAYGLPWFHLMTTSIGRWTGLAYPGPEGAFVDEGVIAVHDQCEVTPISNGNSIDVVYGGSTLQGWTVLASTPIGPTQNFLDVASNFSASLPGPVAPPFTGTVMLPTRHLFYVNVP